MFVLILVLAALPYFRKNGDCKNYSNCLADIVFLNHINFDEFNTS